MIHTSIMILWGTLPNLVFLSSIFLAIEIIGERGGYWVLLFGTFGFSFGGLNGVIVGIVVGVLVVLWLFKIAPNSFLRRM